MCLLHMDDLDKCSVLKSRVPSMSKQKLCRLITAECHYACLSVWRIRKKITFTNLTLQSIICPPEKKIIGTNTILAQGKSCMLPTNPLLTLFKHWLLLLLLLLLLLQLYCQKEKLLLKNTTILLHSKSAVFYQSQDWNESNKLKMTYIRGTVKLFLLK